MNVDFPFLTFMCDLSYFLHYSKVLVYRHGGSSLEVSVVNVISGMYSTLGFKTSTDATGYHFTELLIKYFAAEFKRYDIDT